MKTLISIPTLLSLIRDVKLPAAAISVFQHDGNTYAGLDNKIVFRLDSDFLLHKLFIELSGRVESLIICKDRVYTLIHDNSTSHVVHVRDMSGDLVMSWTHTANSSLSDMMTLVSEQIVIPDQPNQRLILYSLTGQVLKYIPCNVIGTSITTLCSCGDDSVVISDFGLRKVSRFNLATGKVMWTCSDVSMPLGVTCYGSQYVFVASGNSRTIRIFDAKRGKLLSEVSGAVLTDGIDSIYSLHSVNDVLIACTHDEQSLLFFQLRTEL